MGVVVGAGVAKARDYVHFGGRPLRRATCFWILELHVDLLDVRTVGTDALLRRADTEGVIVVCHD